MAFLRRRSRNRSGGEGAEATNKHLDYLLKERGVTLQEYQALKERAIRIIQILPRSYLPRDRADAAVNALRIGR